MAKISKYVDPEVLAGISRLDLRARAVVEGMISGLHRSPFHGFSVEFAEHRSYVPGDDLKHLDWKLFGRADRYYVKLYEEETNLRAYMLVDSSHSMQFKSAETPLSKYDYACTVAASLAFLLLQQQDAVGLALFDSALRQVLPPRSHPGQLRTLSRLMEEAQTERKTDLSALFHQVAQRFKRKGMIVIISDFFAPLDQVMRGLERFRHDKHDVLVLHVMDRQELAFDVDGNVRFRGMEGEQPLTVDARRIRQAYREAVRKFTNAMASGCRQSGIDYVLMDTSRPVEETLSRFLHMRGG